MAQAGTVPRKRARIAITAEKCGGIGGNSCSVKEVTWWLAAMGEYAFHVPPHQWEAERSDIAFHNMHQVPEVFSALSLHCRGAAHDRAERSEDVFGELLGEWQVVHPSVDAERFRHDPKPRAEIRSKHGLGADSSATLLVVGRR